MRLALVTILLAVGCSTNPPPEVILDVSAAPTGESTSLPTSTPSGHGVTVHFVNSTVADVYVPITYGLLVRITDAEGHDLSRGNFCQPSCDECACRDCGEPIDLLR